PRHDASARSSDVAEAQESGGRVAGVKGKIGVLISGRGSNMEALAVACREGRIPATIVLVISNEPAAAGLERARRLGLETAVVDHRASRSREEHDRRVAERLDEHRC